MRLVLDASVCLKWFLIDEEDAIQALELRTRVRSGDIELFEPAIWRSEIASVLARKHPHAAKERIRDLGALAAQIEPDSQYLQRAATLAIALENHLFDTLYHAVAIEHGIDLVTADEHYFRKAQRLGHIVLLRHWRAPHQVREEPAPYRASARKSPARKPRKR